MGKFVQMAVAILFGSSWKTSLLGMAAAAIAGAVAYASGHGEPGFYVLAAGLAALGRLVSDPKKVP